MGVTAILFCLFWIGSGNFKKMPLLFFKNPLVAIALLLFALLVAGVFYSPAPLEDSLTYLKKYRELFYFAVVMCLLQGKTKSARYAENSFLAGSVLLLLLSYAMYFSLIPNERYGYSNVYHITHSFFMAVLAFWCLQKMFASAWYYATFWIALFILTTINLFYIAPGRTGMVVFIALLLLTLFQRLRFAHILIAILATCTIIMGAFFSSENFSTRVTEAVDEIQNYQAGSSRTSLGMRFDWWQNSLTLIEEKPLWGHGTGSFKTVQARLIEDTDTMASDNPHNEYLLIGVQIGYIGLALFVGFLGALFLYSFKLAVHQRYVLQGVVTAMACGCLMNSFLLDSHQGHFFTILSAILCTVPDATTPAELPS